MDANFCDKFAIVGLGVMNKRMPGYSARAFQAEAARLAIKDAGLKKEEIDVCINAQVQGPFHVNDWTDGYSRVLGIPAKAYFSISRGASAVVLSIIMGAKLLELGIARNVLVAMGCNDWSKARSKQTTETRHPKLGLWGESLGELSGASYHSMLASRHMHEYGTTSQQLAAVAIAARQWACLNPDAQLYGRPITMEDYERSQIVCWPFRALDCCVVSDGGSAFIMTTAERAADTRKPPIYIMGVGLGDQAGEMWWDKTNYTALAVAPAKEDVFRQAGIELADIDLAQLYDCFTSEVIVQLEDYGWCAKGEGGAFVEAGNIAPGGLLPVNTGGGEMASHHHADFTGLAEAVIQLRGEAGARQVQDAEICMATGAGGELLSPGMCAIHSSVILRR